MGQEGLKEACFDEVFDAQKNFRVLMDGMSRPGKVYGLYKNRFTAGPEGFNPNLLTILKTLGDSNVSFALGNIENGKIQKYIEINTGMTVSQLPEADFVIFDGRKFEESFSRLNKGTLEFPENSATAIIETDIIRCCECNGNCVPGMEIVMQGPGIKDKHVVSVSGLDEKYIQRIKELNAVFPLGVDVILTDIDGNITCITRTTKAEVR